MCASIYRGWDVERSSNQDGTEISISDERDNPCAVVTHSRISILPFGLRAAETGEPSTSNQLNRIILRPLCSYPQRSSG